MSELKELLDGLIEAIQVLANQVKQNQVEIAKLKAEQEKRGEA